MALGGPVAVTNHWWLDFVINWFVVVAVAPVSAAITFWCYSPLPPVPTEAEWNADEPNDIAEEVHQ